MGTFSETGNIRGGSCLVFKLIKNRGCLPSLQKASYIGGGISIESGNKKNLDISQLDCKDSLHLRLHLHHFLCP